MKNHYIDGSIWFDARDDWFNVVFYSIVWYIFAHTNDSNISLQLIVIASIKLSVEYKTKDHKPFFFCHTNIACKQSEAK